MRIVYVAPFEHSWGTEEHVARAFETLGHDVCRVIERPPGTPGADQLFDDVMDACADADLMLYTKGCGLPPAWADVWRQIEQRGCPTASYHLDLYVGLRRQTQIDTDPFWRTGTVFTADGDTRSAEYFADRGVKHRWLPAAVAHDETSAGAWRAEFDHDVVFVGSWGYHPEWPWRFDLIQLLHSRYGDRFKLYDHHPPLRGRDLNDLYATARVVVGDSLALPGHTNYWSDRFYETVGRGGFLLAPRVPGVERHFVDAKHLSLYDLGNPAELVRQIDWWLDEPSFARSIATAGQAHVRAHHTYVHRVERMLAALELLIAA